MTTFGFDVLGDRVRAILTSLDEGHGLPERAERTHVDLKEEAGRRDKSGTVSPGQRGNERAAQQLAGECCCFANTDGAGAVILGVADDGKLIGTNLDPDWLRARLYELTDRKLTVQIAEAVVGGTRILVIRPPQAVEPVRWKGRINWRVNDRCVEVDAATWHERRMVRTHYDWSAQDSNVPVSAARAPALELVRQFLRDSAEPNAADLADERDQALLRRLNAVTTDGMLTNAAALLFHGRDTPCLDYLRRDAAGTDSTARVRLGDRSLLEELAAVFAAIRAHSPIRHVDRGLVIGQVRDIPDRAARESVVNGVAHREWGLPDPTVVEHIGSTLRVTNPGGFFGGVNELNIITHPSQSRNRALTELLRALRVAEGEGIGVDRMVGEMIRLGHAQPSIRQIEGPFVRASLVADVRDDAWTAWLGELTPRASIFDLNVLLLLRSVVDRGWVDLARAMPVVQLDELETRGAIARLQSLTVNNQPVVLTVAGVPSRDDDAYRLSEIARGRLAQLDDQFGWSSRRPGRRSIAQAYARDRGRISSTELASIVGAQRPNVTAVLRELEEDGLLHPAFPSGRGRGFHYLSSTADPPQTGSDK